VIPLERLFSLWGGLPFHQPPPPFTPPTDGRYQGGKARGGSTKNNHAFRKRVAKRRAKKGYK
jgi:hypothetical protein